MYIFVSPFNTVGLVIRFFFFLEEVDFHIWKKRSIAHFREME
jgi:hypothetical protein